MKAETRYNIGDRLWFMAPQSALPLPAFVDEIRVTFTPRILPGGGIQHDAYTTLCVVSVDLNVPLRLRKEDRCVVPESDLYPTKEHLMKALSETIKDL